MSYDSNVLPLWPLLPNWKRGINEQLEFRTRVLGPTFEGFRQKRRKRIAPRRRFLFEVHPYGDSRRLLDNIRHAIGSREWALPVFPDKQVLEDDLPVGSDVVSCNTFGFDLAVGSLVVLRDRALYTTKFEVRTVTAVDGGSITLDAVTTLDWPRGTLLFPVRRARLRQGAGTVALLTDDVSTLSVDFEVSEPCDFEEYAFEESYRDRPIWPFGHDWRMSRDYDFSRIITPIDNGTALPAYFDFIDKPFLTLNGAWTAKTRDQKAVQRSALYALMGRHKSVWVPSLAQDLVMFDSIAFDSDVLQVRYCGYSTFAQQMENRQDIRIELKNGTVYYRRILSAEEGDGLENLVLDSVLGADVSPFDVRRISFLMLMQQASDLVTISHLTDRVSTVSQVFESVVEPPSE